MTYYLRWFCPDCDYETTVAGRDELRSCQTPYANHLETGSPDSLGIAGAHGPSMSDSDQPVPVLTGVSSIPDDGWNTFQGRLVDISSPWSAEREGEFTLTVYFDSQTHRRLVVNLYGDRGKFGMDGAAFLLMMKEEEPPTT